MPRLERRLRILEVYAAVSIVVFGVLMFSGFAPSRQRFEEIDVQRLNLVEKDGRLVMVIANHDRMPDPITNGKTFKTERPPGMIFYNQMGDENGGLVFGGMDKKSEKYGAYAGLSFDQYKQSQIVAITYNDHSGSRQTGLTVWDRPEIPQSEQLDRWDAMKKLPDGEAKEQAKKYWQAAAFAPARLFVSKDKDKASKVTLYDAMGRPRINMAVSAEGEARLEFLDENGNVAYRVPESKSKEKSIDK